MADTAAAETNSKRPIPLADRVNGLSADASYLASQDWFGSVLAGKPILAVPDNQRQERAFTELLEAGFVHGDVERGSYGYRSTWDGREACALLQASQSEPRS